MKVRKATMNDLEQMLCIYAYAREQMRLSGNPDQWGSTCPSSEIIRNDILNGHSHIVTSHTHNKMFAVFAFMIGEDPTYQKIENGCWLNNDPYGTIHRLASNGKRTGIFRCCLQFCESKAANIRADTHACNYTMQHLLESNGFQRCGQIYTADGDARIAYQRVSSKTAITLFP